MNLTVIVPSRQSLSQAGVRIRYDRIASHLRASGWQLKLQPIDELFGPNQLASGAILFSKCQDARSLILARIARDAGHPVGVDLFDDYFSQRSDVRFRHLRNWLTEMATLADFYICSTERMAEVASEYLPGKPGSILSDPVASVDQVQLKSLLQRKRDEALRSRRLKILWFGIGDNPSFPVGLEDLNAQAGQLRVLQRRGFDVQLTVLTNERSLDTHGLGLLRRLGFGIDVQIWSPEAEQSALADHFISFLPVNAQPFSVAKSLNRGVTALAGGTQLLSTGYPLYAPLSNYVYRDGGALFEDLSTDALKLRADTLNALADTLDKVASPSREAAALASFLGQIGVDGGGRSPPAPRRAVLHGLLTNTATHQFAQKMDWLSLATPLTPAGTEFDAHLGFFGRNKHPALRISKQARALLPAMARRVARSAPSSLGKGPPILLPLDELGLEIELDWLSEVTSRSMAERVVVRDLVIEQCCHLYEQLFDELSFVMSELEPTLVRQQDEPRSAIA